MNLETDSDGVPGIESDGSVENSDQLLENLDQRVQSLSHNQAEIREAVENLQEQNEAIVEALEMLAFGQLMVYDGTEGADAQAQLRNLNGPLRDAGVDMTELYDELSEIQE